MSNTPSTSGQHRVLGFSMLETNLNHELVKQRGLRAAAERNGEPTGSLYQAEIDKLLENLKRLQRESIVIDLVIEDTPTEARQVFVDVAANQKGITKSVQGRFDQRKVANRALSILLDDQGASPLLKGKVETEKSGVSGRSPYLLSAGTLADIARILQTGITGKLSAAREREASDDGGIARLYAATADRFFNVLAGAFSDLTDIANGKDPADLRDSSLVVSTTMLRILAGVFHNLERDGLSDAEIARFFSRVAQHVSAPIEAKTPSGALWIDAAPASAAFTDGTTAPGARAQQVKELVEAITGWATNAPPNL